MIARIWRGWTTRDDEDAYIAYLRKTGMRDYVTTPGNEAAYILVRRFENRTEFVTITFWTSVDAVKAFAGDDVEEAVFYPEDDEYLVDRETKVTHYEIVESSAGRHRPRQ